MPVFINSNAMSVEMISERIGFDKLNNRKMIMGCSAKTKDGLRDAWKWLMQQFKART